MPSILVPGDPRKKMYDQIAKVHGQIVQAKWRARGTNAQITISPQILIHLEESVAFLAQELLTLGSQIERMVPIEEPKIANCDT